MKPIYLEMHAFGPYAGKQIIDFRQLGTRQLFLIYGPTGSGKTTILDAICYALYGDTSGNSRSGTNMRSEYATADEATKVLFAFAIGEKRYCIERSPEQYVAKKRGTGLKHEPMHAALYEWQGDEMTGTLITSRNVKAEVETLLGFKYDQFRQVVLLPQGEFRRLLLAPSAERQQIMQVLFHTERYGRLEQLADAEQKAAGKGNEERNMKIAQYLELAGAADEQALAATIAARTGDVKTKEEEVRVALQQRDAHQRQVQQLEVLDHQWQTLDRAEKELQALQQQETAIAKEREYLQKLEKAELLAEPCQHLADILRQGKAARAEYDRFQAEAQQAQQAEKELQVQSERWEKERPAYTERAKQIGKLEGLQAQAAAYADVCRQEKQAAARAAGAQKEQEKAQASVLSWRQKVQRAQEQTGNLPQLAATAEQKRADVQNAEVCLSRELALEALAQDIHQAEACWRQAIQELTKADEAAAHDRVDFEAVSQRYQQGQAFVLSETLTEGAPCPVCGATTHPHKAAKPADFPQKSDVDRRNALAAESEKKRQAAEVQAKSLETALKEKQKQYEQQRRTYPAEKDSRTWQTYVQEGKQQLADVDRQVKALQQLQHDLVQWQQSLADQETAAEKARQEAEAAGREHVRQIEIKTQAEAVLPEEYRQPEALQQALQGLRKQQQAFDRATSALQQQLAETMQAAARFSGQAAAALKQRENLAAQYTETRTALTEQAQAYGFASLQECQDLQAHIPNAATVRQAIKDYEGQVQQVQGQLQLARQATTGKERPQMQAAYEKLKEANERCQHLSQAVAALQTELRQLETYERQIAKWQQEQAALAKRYETIRSVYDLLKGDATGVNFERYVLGALLDEVLQAANLRLEKMSRSRYELQRSHSREDKRVLRAGLDIEVFDTYTGYARPANTLSGGETFLASLSLALGLADVVQAYSGGIHLDTIFIDEGFGTLDPETLDFALKTLMELKQGGRLVGIISHVGELRERIDTRLAIQKTKRGSTASFELL